jgi:hypothetical protein
MDGNEPSEEYNEPVISAYNMQAVRCHNAPLKLYNAPFSSSSHSDPANFEARPNQPDPNPTPSHLGLRNAGGALPRLAR